MSRSWKAEYRFRSPTPVDESPAQLPPAFVEVREFPHNPVSAIGPSIRISGLLRCGTGVCVVMS